jgi:hypothetical protein
MKMGGTHDLVAPQDRLEQLDPSRLPSEHPLRGVASIGGHLHDPIERAQIPEGPLVAVTCTMKNCTLQTPVAEVAPKLMDTSPARNLVFKDSSETTDLFGASVTMNSSEVVLLTYNCL